MFTCPKQRPFMGSRGRMNVEFRVLGPLEAMDNGQPVDLGPPQQRALLAFAAGSR